MLCTRAGVVRPLLAVVRSFHLFPVPVAICGGAVNDSWDAAISPDGQPNEMAESLWPNDSLPLQSTLALAGLRPEPKSTSCTLSAASSSATSWFLQLQSSARAEAARAGVMLVAPPPASGS